MKMCQYIAILLFILVAPNLVFAANYYIRADALGGRSGTDWTNAYTILPATLTRGDTYYVGDGTYPGYTFNTAASDTQYITVKKATITDHGTDTGWSDDYGDGQAVFGILNIKTGYWVIDGVTGGGPSNWTSGFGFMVTSSDSGYHYYITFDANASNVILKHLEVGPETFGNPGCDTGIYSAKGADNVTLQYSYIKNMADVGMTILNSSGWIFEYNRFDRLGRYGEKDGICGTLGQLNHGAGIELYDTEGFTIRYNNMSNSERSGWIGYYGTGTFNNVEIYGNVFHNTPDFSGTWGNGIIYNTSGAGNVTNLKIYHNTFVNLNYFTILGVSHDTSGNVFNNNIIYNISGTPYYAGCTKDYNASDKTIDGDIHLQTLVSNPFIDSANYNFHLKSSTQTGVALSAPYNIDIDGNLRGADGILDRGAYEYIELSPSPPQNLKVK